MSQTLTEIAQMLKAKNKKMQLIYAFNGAGKTLLSCKFKELIESKTENEETVDRNTKIIYYNAFTEDLFYWDNNLKNDTKPKLKIQPNNFTDWILKEQGRDVAIVSKFQHYANNKITPVFNNKYTFEDDDGKKINIRENSEVTFRLNNPAILVANDGSSIVTQDGQQIVIEQYEVIKISKGEESNFIWSIFYIILDEIIDVLNKSDINDRETDKYNQLEYVFIDDPVTSLDQNHLIELAVDLAKLITKAPSDLRFIITTHNPLFYNVLYNELKNNIGYLLEHYEDGYFSLIEKKGDSNKSFFYHLYLKKHLEDAIAKNQVRKYHFMLLRNLYEKTANFLGYDGWKCLLPKEGREGYLNRIINFSGHSTLSDEIVAEPTPQEKKIVEFLLNHLLKNYGYFQQEEQHG